MTPQLYALKEDLDMVTQDISGLKSSYKSIDSIAKRFDDLWHEQTIQAEQMTRIEKRLNKIEEGLDQVETRLDQVKTRLDQVETRLDQVETRLDQVKTRLDQVEERLGSIEAQLKEELPAMKKLLILICQKLEINHAL